MLNLKYNNLIYAAICTSSIICSISANARQNIYAEEQSYGSTRALKGDSLNESLERDNLIGMSHPIFGNQKTKNDWEKEPQGQMEDQKYKLMGVAGPAGNYIPKRLFKPRLCGASFRSYING